MVSQLLWSKYMEVNQCKRKKNWAQTVYTAIVPQSAFHPWIFGAKAEKHLKAQRSLLLNLIIWKRKTSHLNISLVSSLATKQFILKKSKTNFPGTHLLFNYVSPGKGKNKQTKKPQENITHYFVAHSVQLLIPVCAPGSFKSRDCCSLGFTVPAAGSELIWSV